MEKRSFIVTMVALQMLAGISQAATAPAPDAGQAIRELQSTPAAPLPSTSVPLEPKAPVTEPAAQTQSDLRVMVQAFILSGNQSIDSDSLQSLLKDYLNRPLTLTQLQQAAAQITAHYRQQGWLLAQAYLPAQHIEQGAVQLQIIEGEFGQITLNNLSQVAQRPLENARRNLQEGDGIRSQKLEQALLSLQDLHGVQVSSALSAGEALGSSDLMIDIQDGKAYQGNLALDNYGNQYNGRYRLSGNLALNNPFKLADQISLNALISDENQYYLRGQYELPVGAWNTMVGAAYSWMNYSLAKDFSQLDAHGQADIASLYAKQDWLRQRQYGLSSRLTYDNKQLLDRMDTLALDSDKTLDSLSFQLNGYWYDGLLLGSANSYSLSWTLGEVSLNSADARTQDALLNSAGRFQRLNLSYLRQQQLTPKLVLALKMRGQWADTNLNSSEKFSLGGIYGVRSYPEGEASGDQGWLMNIELSQRLNQHFDVGAFVDAGAITLNKNPISSQDNRRSLSSAGLSGSWQAGQSWHLSLSAAHRLGSEKAQSGDNQDYAIWGKVSWQY